MDADFASDKSEYKSSSGGFAVLIGKHTFFPLAGLMKKQTCTAGSSTEAELTSMHMGLKAITMPLTGLWDVLINNARGWIGGPTMWYEC